MKKQRKVCRAIPLRNTFDCKRYIARLINEVRRGEVKANDATKHGYLIGILLKCIEQSDIVDRLATLERNAAGLEDQRKAMLK